MYIIPYSWDCKYPYLEFEFVIEWVLMLCGVLIIIGDVAWQPDTSICMGTYLYLTGTYNPDYVVCMSRALGVVTRT